MNLRRAAIVYARRGWPLFPVEPGGKRPCGRLVPHGLKQATTDLEQIDEWWDTQGDANIGLVTGGQFDVLDIDGRDGYTNLDNANQNSEPVYGPTVRTGRGWQAYVTSTGHGNTARLAGLAGIDWRGHGGYVVAPPSIHPNGRRYRWCLPSWAGIDAPIRPAPGWLVGLLEQRQQPATVAPVPAMERRPVDRYWQNAVDAECGRVALAVEGERNHTLNQAAFNLGQLTAAGADQTAIETRLVAAALRSGLSPGETLATITSGLRAGAAHPRENHVRGTR